MGGIFGGKPKAPPPPPEVKKDIKTKVDPDRGEQLAEAARKRREIMTRRGRSKLRTSTDSPGGVTRGGTSISG